MREAQLDYRNAIPKDDKLEAVIRAERVSDAGKLLNKLKTTGLIPIDADES